MAEARLADDGVAKKVATLEPRPETPVEIGKPVALVRVPEDGVPKAPLKVTNAPAEPTLTPRAVKTPVPAPVSPVEIGRPVALVRVPEVGVPRIGVTRVGEVRVVEEAKTSGPVPTSSDSKAAKPAEVEKLAERPRVEVATAVTVLSAFIRISVTALGLVRVKMLDPTVVAPKLVRAPAAVEAPVPPEVRPRAFTRLRVVMVDEETVVVAKVEVPVKVGEAEKTSEPVPVSSDTEEDRLAEVIEEAAVP